MAERQYPSVKRLWYKDRKTGERRQTTTYFVHYSANGKRVREATGLTSARAAYDVLLKRREEIRSGRLIRPHAEKVTLTVLEQLVVDNYASRSFRTPASTIRRRFKPLHAYFIGARPINITPADLDAYVVHRRACLSYRGKPITLGTVSLELAHLQRGFSLAVKSKLLPGAPEFPALKLANARKVFVDRPMLAALLAQLPEDRRPIFEVALLTGWRKEAILSRQRRHVDLAEGWLTLDGQWSKNGEPVMVALNRPLRRIFEAQEEKAKALEQSTGQVIPWCFFYYGSALNYRAGARIVDFDHAFEKARQAAGLAHVRFHDLRRGAIRMLRRAKLSEHEIMELVGLKTRDVFDRYDIIDEERRREAGALQEAYYEAEEKKAAVVVPFGKA